VKNESEMTGHFFKNTEEPKTNGQGGSASQKTMSIWR